MLWRQNESICDEWVLIGNLSAHLRLVWGAEQLASENVDLYDADGNPLHEEFDNDEKAFQEAEAVAFEEALIEVSHNVDGSRFVMFGNNISVGDLIIVNDADARMAPSVIHKTVPEFLNDPKLGFTQHTTKVSAREKQGGTVSLGV